MKKVGLAVVTYKDNFGSALQTYATQYVIRSMGFDTGVFDISGVSKSIQKRKIQYYFSRIIHKDEREYVLANMFSLAKKKKKKNDDTYANNMAIRHEVYKDFYSKEISFFPYADSWNSLTDQAKQCEAVVVGSDQLWGAANIAGGYFTLEFVPDEVKKIAYATSFGTPTIPKQIHLHAKKFLERFSSISVREDSGQKIVKQLTNKNIPVVCDPTMLLDVDDWKKLESKDPFIQGNYILTYFMGNNPEQREFVKKLKQQTGYKIVGLLHGSTYIESDELYCDETPYNVGPKEFLNLIRNAKYVCTDSFHCCVFSIIYEKTFFAFRREKDSSPFNTNDRLYTLLTWTNLMSQMKTGFEEINKQNLENIDYSLVSQKVKEKRIVGSTYLKNALM